jgi:hypothetical protein
METFISASEAMIVMIAALSVVFTVFAVFKPRERVLSTVPRWFPWPFETRNKGVYLAMKFTDYGDGEVFCHLKRVSSSCLPTRMATAEDYQRISRTEVINKRVS